MSSTGDEPQADTAYVLQPFTVDADAALPLDVCRPEAVKLAQSGRMTTGVKGRSVVPLAPRRSLEGTGGVSGRQTLPFASSGPVGASPITARLLDGFMVLEAASVELPEEAIRAELESRDLAGFVSQDLLYFKNLAILNLGDNKLGFGGANDVLHRLSSIASLVELRLHCNNLTAIAPLMSDDLTERPFPNLEILDLSYNALPAEAIAQLAILPSLRELDLTCNTLETLPDMTGFERLEVLILQRNRLSDEMELVKLSRCPRLREINLSFNYLHKIPKECVQDRGCFAYLEWLSLANNYFAAEDDLLFLVKMPALRQAVLFGNPVTFTAKKKGHNAGDAATGVAGPDADERKEGTAETALVSLEAERVKGKVVNLVTDDPQRSQRKPKGIGSYSNFRVTKVVEKTIPSNAEWREAGNRYLFDEDDTDEDEADGPAEAEDEEEEPFELDEDDIPRTFITAGAGMAGGEGDPPGDPVKLRSALTALRHALKHPLTDDSDRGPKAYEKTTASMKARRVPVRPYEPKFAEPKAGGARGVPIVSAIGVTRGHPGTEHEEVRELMGTRRMGRRRPAGAGAGAGGMDDSNLPVRQEPKGSRVQTILHATTQAKASVEQMEAMLDKLSYHRKVGQRATARADQSVAGFLSEMDEALKRYV